MTSLINANSPMVWDGTMLGALKVYARANQATIVTPFILAGAMRPVTAAGTLAQVLAEVLSALPPRSCAGRARRWCSASSPAPCPCSRGRRPSARRSRRWCPSRAAQLARRLGVPFRTGGSLCGSKIPDAQAAYESAQTLLPTLLAGINFVLHAAGWLEGGLASGYEKFIMDADQLGMMQVLAGGVDLSENGQAMDAIREVGARRSHFLGCAHTQAQFRDRVLALADRRQQQLRAMAGRGRAGRRPARQQAVEEMLASTRRRPSIPAIDEALHAFIAKKKAAVPDSNV